MPLYDKDGQLTGQLIPHEIKLIIGVVVTRDDFGALATNLKLLLEKEPEGAYPWVVNIIDLGNLAEAWKSLGYNTDKLRHYLEQRILVHGKVFSPDELDFAGFFLRHGSLNARALRAR